LAYANFRVIAIKVQKLKVINYSKNLIFNFYSHKCILIIANVPNNKILEIKFITFQYLK